MLNPILHVIGKVIDSDHQEAILSCEASYLRLLIDDCGYPLMVFAIAEKVDGIGLRLIGEVKYEIECACCLPIVSKFLVLDIFRHRNPHLFQLFPKLLIPFD